MANGDQGNLIGRVTLWIAIACTGAGVAFTGGILWNGLHTLQSKVDQLPPVWLREQIQRNATDINKLEDDVESLEDIVKRRGSP